MFPNVSEGKQSACNVGDPGLLPGSGRSPGKGNGYSLQYSCLGNLIDRGAWRATVHGAIRVGQEWAHFHFFHLRRWVCLEQRQWGENNRRETRVHHTYSVHRFKIFISCDSLGSFYAAWLGLELELNGKLMAVVTRASPLFMNCDQQPEITLSVNSIKPLPCIEFCYGMVSVRQSQPHFHGKSFNITVIQVYAPTSKAEEAEVEWFYEDLQDHLELTPKKDVLFIIGDWNAKVGSQEIPGVTGKSGLGIQNEAGQKLIEFCQENALVIANTLFQQHKRRLCTWTSPDGQHRNQIDYILCRQRWRSSI